MKTRRIMTYHNEKGKSTVKWDNEIESVPGRSGFSHATVWATKQLPAQFTDEDPRSWEIGTTIENGSVFRIIQYDRGVSGEEFQKRLYRRIRTASEKSPQIFSLHEKVLPQVPIRYGLPQGPRYQEEL
jgi:hypothetical protein